MKKIKILLCFLFLINIALSSFAQLQEVKGIETKWITYDGGLEYKICEKSHNYYPNGCRQKTKDSYFGYSFYNMNNYPVTVEAELWILDEEKKLLDTKSFVLDAKEGYVWKRESTTNYRVYVDYDLDLRENESMMKRSKVNGNYYVIFKAYKND